MKGERALTGRIGSPPDRLLREEILEPHFRMEAERLLPWYVLAEKVLTLEYLRMGVLDHAQAARLGAALSKVDAAGLDPGAAMTDMVFAIESRVLALLEEAPPPGWHVDRSRNDLQACAQLLYGKERLLELAALVAGCVRAGHTTAARHLDDLMPGYTHLQPAQVTTPAHYLTALTTHLLRTLSRLRDAYAGLDLSPLGAGAMTGLELPWDRPRMARLLGFAAAQPHTLVAVASRSWVLEVCAELSTAGVTLSRFVTDLMTWSGGGHGFVDLPDELAGISSAMPQKRNFPLLERVRGRAAHLSGHYLDAVLCQRATPYGNSVEVAKEGGVALTALLDGAASLFRLLRLVLERLRFRTEVMRAACEREYLGGFTLANLLTLRTGVPAREAQVIAGRYIAAAVAAGRPPFDADPQGLAALAAPYGVSVAEAEGLLRDSGNLRRMLGRGPGSPEPEAVASLLDEQRAELAGLERDWERLRATHRAAPAEVDRRLGEGPPIGGR